MFPRDCADLTPAPRLLLFPYGLSSNEARGEGEGRKNRTIKTPYPCGGFQVVVHSPRMVICWMNKSTRPCGGV